MRMDRRSFITRAIGCSCAASASTVFQACLPLTTSHDELFETDYRPLEDFGEGTSHIKPHEAKLPQDASIEHAQKAKHFDRNYQDDVFLSPQQMDMLNTCLGKLNKVQRFIGYARFNLISYDEMLYFARNYSQLENFSPSELAFMDWMFDLDPKPLGFYGLKVTNSITQVIDKKSVKKIPHSGHYLYQGDPLKVHDQLRRDIGPSMILTSGVRNVSKQFLLFFTKVKGAKGNLSLASRSLAPPGYSYHGIGDFDVGKKGLGGLNFTSKFSETEEFRKLVELGYIDIRYPQGNEFGVRYEPWHIEVKV